MEAKIGRTITPEIRREALPWPGDNIVDTYLKLHPNFKFREQFIQLLLESYHAFLAGCPRASIIVGGEALLRFVYDRVICFIGDGGMIKLKAGLALNKDTDPWDIDDQLSFCDALSALKQTGLYSNEIIDRAYAVKELRNCAAHGELPVLSDWDPDDPRSDEGFVKMLDSEDYKFPEAYQFFRRDSRVKPVRLDMRNYAPSTLRSMGWEDRFAGIQFLLVMDIIKAPPRAQAEH
jgi:hypothetical protein